MIIGYGPEYPAYVLSSIMFSGLHLFRFDPKTFSPSPQWARRTSNSNPGNAVPYLINFGNFENILYIFGYHNGANKVSRVSPVTGDILWTYGLYGNLTES
jgi:hypothetical protein